MSATAPALPTGPIIVLVSFSAFALSLALAPRRGLLAQAFRHRRFQRAVHRRQGLLALAHNQPIYEAVTRRLLQRQGLLRADGLSTEAGRVAIEEVRLDEARWHALRQSDHLSDLAPRDDGLTRIDAVLTPDQIADLDARLRPRAVS